MANISTRERKGLGWVKDRLDFRDHVPQDKNLGLLLPSDVDLRPKAPPIVDQGQTNSCVGNASASIFRFMRRKMGLTDDFQPSRAFIYWYARHVPRLGWENQDEGAMPRDAMQTMISNGVVSEEDWPFNPKKINTEPTSGLLSKAKAHRITEGHYVRMTAADNLFHLKLSLSKELPFLIGIAVYSSFYDTRSDGMVSMPKTSETYEGGHLLWCCGFSNSMHRFICPNSWGEGEGDKGYFYLPYEYVAEPALAGDFWRIELVS